MARKQGDQLAGIREWINSQDVPELADLVKLVGDLDLTPLQKRALATNLLPQAVFWTEKQRADFAQVSQRQWYNLQKNQKFIDAGIVASRRYLGYRIPRIMAAYCRDAELGNCTAQQGALTQCGLLGPGLSTEREPQVSNTFIFNYGNSLSDEDRDAIDRNIGAVFGQNGHGPKGSGSRFSV